ncbi:hypothetical protein ACHAWX_007147 [Stephanocyclus meneghinianus]
MKSLPQSIASPKRTISQAIHPYANYHPNSKSNGHLNQEQEKIGRNDGTNNVTIYSSAFAGRHHVVGCTSNGVISVWNIRQSFIDLGNTWKEEGRCIDDDDGLGGGDERSRKRYFDQCHQFGDNDNTSRRRQDEPILCVLVDPPPSTRNTRHIPNSRVLYDVQFLPNTYSSHSLLVVSGDPGVVIYKWSDFERAIRQIEDTSHNSEEDRPRSPPIVDIRPLTRFLPHPSPAETIEINSTAYDGFQNLLYGAAGDGFGCYQWDLESETLLGTFGGYGVGRIEANRGHGDYLHVVKTVAEGSSGGVMTGAEDGTMGFWNGKERKLIQMVKIQSTMDKNKRFVTGQSSNRTFMSNTSTIWNNGSNLWISSMDTNGNWLAVSGGAENVNNGIAGRSSAVPSTSGFMTIWHLPTRSFTSGCVTRESINTVACNPSLDLFVTGGNEGRISYWEATKTTRVGRSWCTPSATYDISVLPESGIMVAGGSGGLLDCFVDQIKVSQLRF